MRMHVYVSVCVCLRVCILVSTRRQIARWRRMKIVRARTREGEGGFTLSVCFAALSLRARMSSPLLSQLLIDSKNPLLSQLLIDPKINAFMRICACTNLCLLLPLPTGIRTEPLHFAPWSKLTDALKSTHTHTLNVPMSSFAPFNRH